MITFKLNLLLYHLLPNHLKLTFIYYLFLNVLFKIKYRYFLPNIQQFLLKFKMVLTFSLYKFKKHPSNNNKIQEHLLKYNTNFKQIKLLFNNLCLPLF